MQRHWICTCVAGLLLPAGMARAQSTFGSIVGTIRDPAQAVVQQAVVKVTNVDQNVSRSVLSTDTGGYEVLNLAPGHYKVEVSKPGFQPFVFPLVDLLSRQVVRVDAVLQVGSTEQSVNVTAEAGVIASESPTVASTMEQERLSGLPVNFRASGSTSPYLLLATLPGVQGDNGSGSGVKFSIQGALPAQSQSSIDGISAQHVRNNAPLVEIFPSTETIAEMKVQGVGNNAEYGAVGDITTVTKSGTNDLHGSLFWYHQNRALDANRYGALTKPQKVSNDFGFSAGGPVWIPKLYNGKDKTFFFAAYEDSRYPRGSTIQNAVPTDALRRGDFNGSGITVRDPLNGLAFPSNTIPASRISPVATGFLKLYPLPNSGAAGVLSSANYIDNRAANLDSRQFDVKIDHYLTSKQSVFVRYSAKNGTQLSPTALTLPSLNQARDDRSLIVSHNYSLSSAWLNEFRLGFTTEQPNQDFGFDGRSFTKSLGLQGLGPDFPFNGLPDLSINNFTGVGVDRTQVSEIYRTFQINNNTTWTHGAHTFKFGIDIRNMRSKTALGFIGADNYGNFDFGGAFSGNSFGDFLLGLPTDTSYAIVTADNDGHVTHYHAYAQDTWRVSRRLTLDYGLRYELHPGFKDSSYNIGNFDPSVPVTGRLVYPSAPSAGSLLAPGLLASINACQGTPNRPDNTGPGIPGVGCTPVVTASAAGIPETLRKTYKLGFYPRFGFAYRPFSDDRTVVRGSFGMYNMAILGAVFYSLTGTAQTDVRIFNNIGTDGQPLFAWPQIKTGGSGVVASDYGNSYFGTANQIDFKNPYAMQWSLSVDRNLGWSTGLRVSYIGLKSVNLPYAPNINQNNYSTQFYALQPLTARPFPYWYRVESRNTGAMAFYNALQVEFNRRWKDSLTFNTAYTFAKNLTDTGGPSPSGFSGETGGDRIMDSLNRHGSWGNDYATRGNRFIGTVLYQLPFGKGQRWMRNANPVVDAVLGGWQLANILMVQSGPFLTPYYGSGVGDPSGTGSGLYRAQRPDRLAQGMASNPNTFSWLDRSAFACPGVGAGATQWNCAMGINPAKDAAPIGRFGNSGVGIATGPGTVNLSMGLRKSFALTERMNLSMEGTFTNVPNHVNLADPVLAVNNASFGRITSARQAEFGGSRTGQVGMRVTF
jgi:hypothetical protein